MGRGAGMRDGETGDTGRREPRGDGETGRQGRQVACQIGCNSFIGRQAPTKVKELPTNMTRSGAAAHGLAAMSPSTSNPTMA